MKALVKKPDAKSFYRNAGPGRAVFISTMLGMATLMAGAGCQGDISDTAIEESESALFVASDTIWTSLKIPVCWTNPDNDPNKDEEVTRKDEVKRQITDTWQANSRLSFTGWGTCANSSKGIRIQIVNGSTMPHTHGTGKLIDQDTEIGMVLNLGPTDTKICPDGKIDQCILGHAVHEFGHALGFNGEDMRADSPKKCSTLSVGDVIVGNYDANSIMNHCNDNRVYGTLSTTDLAGLEQFYGTKTSVGRKKDAILWNNTTAYFMFGSTYVKYDMIADHMDDFYPLPIAGNWKDWPSAWNSGVDAITDYNSTKLFMFRGNQYLRYDKVADKVDADYPRTLPGGWRNWPSTWTYVDAAIKWPTNDKIYMFRGSEYIRLTGVTVDQGYNPPKRIADNWDLPWTSNIDYVIYSPNSKIAYFFKGTEYVRYYPETDEVSDKIGIVGKWPGVKF